MSLSMWLYLSALLFAIGASTVLVRRNAIIVFMGVELMLNATNLAFVTFARLHGDLTGQVVAFFCSEPARFITGAHLNVDGGAYAGLM